MEEFLRGMEAKLKENGWLVFVFHYLYVLVYALNFHCAQKSGLLLRFLALRAVFFALTLVINFKSCGFLASFTSFQKVCGSCGTLLKLLPIKRSFLLAGFSPPKGLQSVKGLATKRNHLCKICQRQP